jgi:uncharacterized membrane protein
MAFNPNDKRIIVPKRTRLGWTLNFGRPASWLILLALIAVALCIASINNSHR